MSKTVIIGGGIGGFTVAQELRKLQWDGDITIVDSQGLPYDRPPLSKDLLTGEKSPSDLHFVDPSWYKDNYVELLERSALSIDPSGRTVTLDDGSTIAFDNLVLATGGLPRTLGSPGFEHPEVVTLRTVTDADNLRRKLRPGVRLVIIGAGLIGAELASSATSMGAEVTLIDPAPVSLVPAVGEELARRLHDMHGTSGVAYVNSIPCSLQESSEDGAFEVEVRGQQGIIADVVVVAVGIVPEESLARSASLDFDNGVLVDADQKTSIDGIWAVGDCSRTRTNDGFLERRHEHWDNAVQCGRRAAASIAGKARPQAGAAWFWSDRYGVHVEGVGDMSLPGNTVVRLGAAGEPEVAFRLDNDSGRVVGAAAIDNSIAVRAARRMIERGSCPDPESLADRNKDLRKLAR